MHTPRTCSSSDAKTLDGAHTALRTTTVHMHLTWWLSIVTVLSDGHSNSVQSATHQYRRCLGGVGAAVATEAVAGEQAQPIPVEHAAATKHKGGMATTDCETGQTLICT
jgi:hypothetical protein